MVTVDQQMQVSTFLRLKPHLILQPLYNTFFFLFMASQQKEMFLQTAEILGLLS